MLQFKTQQNVMNCLVSSRLTVVFQSSLKASDTEEKFLPDFESDLLLSYFKNAWPDLPFSQVITFRSTPRV